MHFFKNSVSFIAIMCVCGATVAATTGRVGVTAVAGTASRRLPSLSNVVKYSASSSSTSTTSSTLVSDSECVDDYRDCMKSETACGPDFEECTTNVLFHGRMAECFSTLYQCSSNALNSLMGTSSLSSLSNVSSYVDGTNNTEVARYTYPTDGSVMGMDIIGAATRNKLSTSDCVKKYKRCLNKDDVCGEDFELCTSESEFKKQAAMCDSVLSRCQKEGFQQLFGESKTVKPVGRNFKPDADGDITQWIADGATLAASNAVNTCYKVVDNCFASACAKNPYSCVEDTNWTVVNAAESIVETGISTSADNSNRTGKQMATDVRKFFRSACTDTIGANQYCFMTFNDGKKPTKADLQDEDLREEIFGEAYDSRKTILTTKVNELVKKFDKTARDKCTETFKSCAVRSCGGGSGAACYSRVFGGGTQKSINNSDVYSDIKNGCEAVVNSDANCVYMASMQDESNTYTFEIGGTTTSFGVLFPTYTNGNSDSQIVAALNADLSTAYNDVAIAQMKKQCQNVVANCVKSMCGTDYQNCFRNRNDVSVKTYTSNNAKFNNSMNKVGGVLDYTIVQGLCASTVKNSDTCSESLAIAKVGISDGESDTGSTWGNNTSISNAWRTSAQNGYSLNDMVPDTDDMGRQLCTCTNGGKQVCEFEEGGVTGCSTAVTVSRDVLIDKSAVNNVFQDVLADVEAEAQAIYKAKLTKEQNVCLAQNSGANPNATFVWAKLKGKMSSDYASNGLGNDGSVESNDLYGSFCRVKVTLQSEDHDVQTLLNGGTVKIANLDDGGLKGGDGKKDITGTSNANAYFAAGDAFTCGAWLSADNLDKITEIVGTKAREEAGQGSSKDKSTRIWATLGSAVAGGVIGGVVYDKIQTSDKWGGLLNKNLAQSKASSNCSNLISQARDKYAEATSNNLPDDATAEAKAKDKQTKQTSMNTARKLASQAQSQSGYASANIPSLWIGEDGKWDKGQLGNFKKALDDIDQSCADAENAPKHEANGQKQRAWTDATVGLASAGVTAGLAYGITASVQKAKYETAENEAIKEWMDNIGSKIHCYIGGQLVGDYGDIVSVSIDEEE